MLDPLGALCGVFGSGAWLMRQFCSLQGLQPHALATAGYRRAVNYRKSLMNIKRARLAPLLVESFSRVPVRPGSLPCWPAERTSPGARMPRHQHTLDSVPAISASELGDYVGECFAIVPKRS